MNVRMARYDRLDGRDLRDGAFLTTANQFRDEAEPFDVETLTLEIDSRVLTFTGSYGVTDRFDISAAVPLVELSMNGTRVNTYRGRQVVAGRGGGHVARPRRRRRPREVRTADGPSNGLALAGEVRLPTGREDDLLGAGTTAFSALVIASSEHGPIGYHGNLSLSGGGLSNEVAYRGAVCVSASDRVTLVGELVGRRYGDVGRITEVRVPHADHRQRRHDPPDPGGFQPVDRRRRGRRQVEPERHLDPVRAHAAADHGPRPALGRGDADRARLRVRDVRPLQSERADAIVQRSSAFLSSKFHSRAVNRGD